MTLQEKRLVFEAAILALSKIQVTAEGRPIGDRIKKETTTIFSIYFDNE